jgi:alginate O-acetyltransferase complex protein AlgI
VVFSSHLFVFWFLPLAMLAYFAAPARGRHFVLALSGYVFYGWANPAFVLVMLLSTLIDYAAGLGLTGGLRVHGIFRRPAGELPQLVEGGPRSRAQRGWVAFSVVANLGLLAFFKYFDFAAGTYNATLQALGLQNLTVDSVLRVALPLGISFYTFQSMSYTLDVYRGRARPVRSFVDFAAYVAMYPQLVAGPILRFADVAHQLLHRTHSVDKLARGAAFFALGMAKKVLLANPCGKVADLAFDAGSVTAVDAWYGVVAYAFQIYFDFSGYSDMAIGLGLMLGFVFAKNFDSPYKAESLTDFWRRWHISLSTWLRDYLYVPLGGNRLGPRRTYVNLMVVMLLGGLWHGAAWTFVVWGGIHGLWLSLERAAGGSLWHRLPLAARRLATFVVVLVAWVFFRAPDLPAALRYLGSMVGLGTPQEGAGLLAGVIYQPYYVLSVGLAAAIAWGAPQTWDWTRRLGWARATACLGLFWLALGAMATQGYNPFIYFFF